MPLDPRIALQGIGFQAPDFLGAVRQGQDIRKNQMAMARQAAADEALFNYFNPPPGARPMNVSATDQTALRGFQDVFASMPAGVGRGPPITGQPLPSAGAPPASRMASRAAAAVASAVAPPAAPAPPMANAMRAAPADVRSAMMARMAPAGEQPDISTLMPFADDPRVKAVLDQRAAQQKADAEADEKKQKVEQEQFTRTVAGVLANPDDAGLAAAAQQYPQFAQDIGRIAQLPFEQRTSALTSLMATLPGGADFVKLFAPKPEVIDVGGRKITVDMNPNSPTYLKELRSDDVTPDPNRPQTMQFITDASGNIIGFNRATGQPTDTGVDAPAPRDAAGSGSITPQRRGQLQSQIATIDNDVLPTLDQMDALLATGDVITGFGAEQRLVVASALALAGNQDAKRQVAATQRYQNLAKTLAAGMAKSLGSNPSNADVQLLGQVSGGMIGQEASALSATTGALRARAEGLRVDAQDMLGGGEAASAGGGGPINVGTEDEYRRLPRGTRYVAPDGQVRTKQ